MDDPLFNEKNEVKVKFNNLKFGKVGDWFKGTLTDNSRQIQNNMSEDKEMQTIFEFKAHGGSFHPLVKNVPQETPVLIEKGDFWSYITGKPIMLNQLKKAKLGQVIGLRFTGYKESKKPGFQDAKIISVFIGDMDPEYQGETSADSR